MFLDVEGKIPVISHDLTDDAIRETLTKELKSAHCNVKITKQDELEWQGPWWPDQWIVFPFWKTTRVT